MPQKNPEVKNLSNVVDEGSERAALCKADALAKFKRDRDEERKEASDLLNKVLFSQDDQKNTFAYVRHTALPALEVVYKGIEEVYEQLKSMHPNCKMKYEEDCKKFKKVIECANNINAPYYIDNLREAIDQVKTTELPKINPSKTKKFIGIVIGIVDIVVGMFICLYAASPMVLRPSNMHSVGLDFITKGAESIAESTADTSKKPFLACAESFFYKAKKVAEHNNQDRLRQSKTRAV